VNKFLAKRFSTIWALVTVIGHSSKLKVQEPFGFGRFHEAMRQTSYFSGFPEMETGSAETQASPCNPAIFARDYGKRPEAMRPILSEGLPSGKGML